MRGKGELKRKKEMQKLPLKTSVAWQARSTHQDRARSSDTAVSETKVAVDFAHGQDNDSTIVPPDLSVLGKLD